MVDRGAVVDRKGSSVDVMDSLGGSAFFGSTTTNTITLSITLTSTDGTKDKNKT